MDPKVCFPKITEDLKKKMFLFFIFDTKQFHPIG